MIRIAVISSSDEFHRSVRRSLRHWGVAQLAISARSLREITSFIGFDVLVAHELPEEELDAVGDADLDRPVVLVGEFPISMGSDGTHVVMGPEDDPNRVIAAAVALAHGLAVRDGIDPGVYVRPGDSPSQQQAAQVLTPRETEVLQLISAGHPNREIANRLGISENTVKYHLSGLFAKLGVANRTEATFEGLRKGIVSL